jgi:transposase
MCQFSSMGKTYRPYLPEQDLLLPPSLRDWLPEGHLAYFVSDLIDELDLSAVESYYEQEERGYPPYHPRMMTKILVYGYCVGVFSSRRLQKRLHEDIAFRVLASDNQPDFRTLSDFRKIHLSTLQGLFEQVLRMALELGALKLGRVAIDGSKFKGNASKHKAMSYKRMKEDQKRLKQEVRRLLKEETSCPLSCSAGNNGCNGFERPSVPWKQGPAKKPRRQRRSRTVRAARRKSSRKRKTSTTSPIRNRAF